MSVDHGYQVNPLSWRHRILKVAPISQMTFGVEDVEADPILPVLAVPLRIDPEIPFLLTGRSASFPFP
jgi:hypothetical protein